jgi:hypothetical protein
MEDRMKRYLIIGAFLLFGFCCFGLGFILSSLICPIKSHKSDAIVEQCHEYPKIYKIAGAGDEGFRAIYESPSLNPSPQGMEIIEKIPSVSSPLAGEDIPSVSSPLAGEGRERGY